MSETEPSPNHTNRGRVFARMAQFGRAALGAVLDTALPPLCASCRTPLSNPGGLCPACWSRVSFIAPPYCERLGIPFPYDPGPGILSMEAIADPPAYGRARAAVRYDDIVRDLVHRLKYGDRLDLATSMGQWMARAGRELLIDADALPAVPLPGGPAALAAAVGGGSIRLQHSPGWWHQRAESGPRRGPQAHARNIAAGWSVTQCAGHERVRRICRYPGRQGCHPGKRLVLR